MQIRNILYPGTKFVKETYASARSANSVIFILYKGIVIDVLKNIDNGTNASFVPPFSIYAKIIGEDVNTRSPLSDVRKWYPPLFPIHSLELPEPGEEIWILKESDDINANGFWICRVNDNNNLNKYLARTYLNGTPLQKYGFDFTLESIEQAGPQKERIIFSIPVRNGDVFQQGRSGSYIRHSFNPNNKQGILESGIKDAIKYPALTNTSVSIGKTLTKTIHLALSKIKDVINFKKIKVSLNATLAETPAINEIDDDTDRNIILNQSEEIYNISTSKESEKQLFRQVLGEKQNLFLNNIMLLLQTVMKNNSDIITLLKNHTHVFPAYTSNTTYTIDIGKEGTRNINVTTAVPAREVTILDDAAGTIDTVLFESEILTQLLDTYKTQLEDHLSKHQFIN